MPSHRVTTMSHNSFTTFTAPPIYVIGVGILGVAQGDKA